MRIDGSCRFRHARGAGRNAAHVFHEVLGRFPPPMQSGSVSPCFKKRSPRRSMFSVVGMPGYGEIATFQQQGCFFHTGNHAIGLGAETHKTGGVADAQHFHSQIHPGAVIKQKFVKPCATFDKMHGKSPFASVLYVAAGGTPRQSLISVPVLFWHNFTARYRSTGSRRHPPSRKHRRAGMRPGSILSGRMAVGTLGG